MRPILRFVGIAAISSSLAIVVVEPAAAASVQHSDAVPMPRFEVNQNRGYFDFDIRYDDQTELVQEVKLTWVSPAAHKRSLRVGDTMIAVDGRPVTDLPYRQLLDLMKRELEAGESRTIEFTRSQLFRRLTITHTTKGPNKPPEPTP